MTQEFFDSPTMRISNLTRRNQLLTEALEGILWKLSHKHSPSGEGGDCEWAKIDRNDATVRKALLILEG